MQKVRISVGIPAYNEEQNISELLKAIAGQQLKTAILEKVFVIDDGSTDSTRKKVESFIKTGKLKGKIELINLKKRRGKWNAINIFLKKAKSEVLILESADTIPKSDCFNLIARHFYDKKTGIVASRIVPLNDKNTFFGFAAHLIYELHHEISLESPKFGELIAFRKKIKRIRPTIVDEDQIASMISHLGYAKKYASSAIVYNKGPETISDFIEQRRRIYCGHLRLKKDKKYSAPTLDSWKIFLLTIKHIQLKNIFKIISASLLECYSRFLGCLDYASKNWAQHILWKPIKSVKNLEK